MQFAKDSFYMAMRERLAAVNPQRVVVLNGATRPAVIVAENELVIPIQPLPDAFYIEWGEAQVVKQQTGSRPLVGLKCTISYHTLGTSESGVDRGRTLAALDNELLSICQPLRTAKRNYTQTPSVDLGTGIFWTAPELGEVSTAQGGTKAGAAEAWLERSAHMNVFFYPEVSWL